MGYWPTRYSGITSVGYLVALHGKAAGMVQVADVLLFGRPTGWILFLATTVARSALLSVGAAIHGDTLTRGLPEK